ncbi:hypothetical protein Pelo_15899 [Pelomyxa schiedti]|nr:hypothetical protein Pelo_15899 [Pelomyxa schiedti]
MSSSSTSAVELPEVVATVDATTTTATADNDVSSNCNSNSSIEPSHDEEHTEVAEMDPAVFDEMLLRHTFAWLTPRQLGLAALVCKRWEAVARSDTVWKYQLLELMDEYELNLYVATQKGTSESSPHSGLKRLYVEYTTQAPCFVTDYHHSDIEYFESKTSEKISLGSDTSGKKCRLIRKLYESPDANIIPLTPPAFKVAFVEFYVEMMGDECWLGVTDNVAAAVKVRGTDIIRHPNLFCYNNHRFGAFVGTYCVRNPKWPDHYYSSARIGVLLDMRVAGQALIWFFHNGLLQFGILLRAVDPATLRFFGMEDSTNDLISIPVKPMYPPPHPDDRRRLPMDLVLTDTPPAADVMCAKWEQYCNSLL